MMRRKTSVPNVPSIAIKSVCSEGGEVRELTFWEVVEDCDGD